ncbi:MAG: MEDS domain-containing protein [Thaumarchaeota archaeon]|nr:MEDS domain-containing protein [Nitrososphaerota archaeon]
MSVIDFLSVPFRYIDALEHKQHILLFYEDPEYARLVEFRFIKNGLQSGEQCIYATEEDSGMIVLKLLSYGVPLHHFQTGKLRVVQIHETCGGYDEILKKCKEDVHAILDDLISPYRIVSRIVPNVETLDGISVEMELEKETHCHFDNFGGSLMCPYDISKIEPKKRKEWIRELQEMHHTTIYLPKSGQGGVFFPS